MAKMKPKVKIIRELYLRKPGWTDCVVNVIDVGSKSFWGQLIDLKKDEIINPLVVYEIGPEWIPALSLEEFIDTL